jgi:hypothetical protein
MRRFNEGGEVQGYAAGGVIDPTKPWEPFLPPAAPQQLPQVPQNPNMIQLSPVEQITPMGGNAPIQDRTRDRDWFSGEAARSNRFDEAAQNFGQEALRPETNPFYLAQLNALTGPQVSGAQSLFGQHRAGKFGQISPSNESLSMAQGVGGGPGALRRAMMNTAAQTQGERAALAPAQIQEQNQMMAQIMEGAGGARQQDIAYQGAMRDLARRYAEMAYEQEKIMNDAKLQRMGATSQQKIAGYENQARGTASFMGGLGALGGGLAEAGVFGTAPSPAIPSGVPAGNNPQFLRPSPIR